MNTPQFESFVNHWSSCQKCHPRHDRYCVDGRNLWIDDQAAFVASLGTLAERQYWLSVIAREAPKFIERVKAKVLEKFKGKK